MNGKSPFEDWFVRLDNVSKAFIIRAIQKAANGEGKHSIKSLKDGIFEIKIYYGPGYRVYFSEYSDELIILLMGGDKKSQSRDIAQAKKYWKNYGK